MQNLHKIVSCLGFTLMLNEEKANIKKVCKQDSNIKENSKVGGISRE